MCIRDRPNRRETSAYASGAASVLILHRRHFAPLIADTEFLNRALALLCSRLREASGFVERVCLHRLESRLARHLLASLASEQPEGACATLPTCLLYTSYLAHRRTPPAPALGISAAYLILMGVFSHAPGWLLLVFWLLWLAVALPLALPDLRRRVLSGPLFAWFQKVLPPMSDTEREAIEAGTVW